MKKNIIKFLKENLVIMVVFMTILTWVPKELFCSKCENINITRYLITYSLSLSILLINFFIWKKNSTLSNGKLFFFFSLLISNIAIILSPIISPISFSGAMPSNGNDLVIGIVLVLIIVSCIGASVIQLLIYLTIAIIKLKNHLKNKKYPPTL